MTDKVQKIREEVEKLKSNLMYGACSSQVAMETRCKEEAYNDVLAILDTMQEEPAPKILEDILNAKTPAESLGISAEEHDKIIDQCLYGKEPEMVDIDDLPKEEPVSEDLEEEIERIRKYHFINDDFDKAELDGRTISNIARHFAAWQKKQMMAKAIEARFTLLDGFCIDRELYKNYKVGGKYKLIIIKEDLL